MADPVEIGSLALAGRFDATCDAVADTQAVLAALHGAGWRVVRTEQIGWTRPNPWDIGPAWRGLYKGNDPGDGWTPAHLITDEWTPGGGGRVSEREQLTAALEDSGLLQDEYPDEMAARSCTCEPEAVCGAHRLLSRYNQLFEAFQRSNRERRESRAALRAAGGAPEATDG